MSEMILAGELPQLADVINRFPAGSETLMILEKLPLRWLDEEARQNGLIFETFKPETALDGWDRGRIFDAAGELRWERNGATFQVVYTGAPVDFPGLIPEISLDLAAVKTVQQTYYLWGQRLSPDQLADIARSRDEILFIELQVPRLLRYPVSATFDDRVKLAVVEYYHPQVGHLVHYRFKGVEAA